MALEARTLVMMPNMELQDRLGPGNVSTECTHILEYLAPGQARWIKECGPGSHCLPKASHTSTSPCTSLGEMLFIVTVSLIWLYVVKLGYYWATISLLLAYYWPTISLILAYYWPTISLLLACY